MTQPIPRQVLPVRTHSPRRWFRRALLIALATAGCDADSATGPRAGPPPADAVRLSRLVLTDTQAHAQTLNHFIYDQAGRLSRMDFYISAVEDGPPVRKTAFVEHQYSGDVLTRTDYFEINDGGAFVNWSSVHYTYDGRGYLTRMRQDVTTQAGVRELLTTFRYNGQGQRVEQQDYDGDVLVYTYAADGSLASLETRWQGGSVLRQTFAHDAGRNPFYRRLALANSVILPIYLPSLLLSPANLTRLETRVGDDPTLVASLTNEYQYDSAGRPVHIRQRFVNDIIPDARGVVLFMDLEYEPAG